jgi:hypothetical protein
VTVFAISSASSTASEPDEVNLTRPAQSSAPEIVDMSFAALAR